MLGIAFLLTLAAIIVLLVRQQQRVLVAPPESAPVNSLAFKENAPADSATSKSETQPSEEKQSDGETVSPPETSRSNLEGSQGSLAKLKGSWMRSDGSYVIEVRKVDSDGTLEAAYYNPNPIHVSQAKATQKENVTQLFLELKDVGYPGCTYRLQYVPENDFLQGTYYQAAQQQEFEVVFARVR